MGEETKVRCSMIKQMDIEVIKSDREPKTNRFGSTDLLPFGIGLKDSGGKTDNIRTWQ